MLGAPSIMLGAPSSTQNIIARDIVRKPLNG